MSKEVAIIIPAYNAQSYISNLIRTIYAQTYIDFCKIIIINDNEQTQIYDFLYDLFPSLDLVILKSKTPQSGPGSARNVGLNYVIKQNIPYIIFADADDIFYSTMAIEILYETIQGNIDYVYSPFYQEETQHLEINNDSCIWLFGKIYKTSIIKEWNIYFPESFLGEDQSFNLYYQIVINNKKEIDIPLYVQKYNKNSITHIKDNMNLYHYFSKTYNNLLNTLLLIEHNTKIEKEKIKVIIPERIIRIYFDYNRDYNNADKRINILDHNQLLQKMYQLFFKKYWSKITQEEWFKAWYSLKMEEIPNIGFTDFLKIMTSEETNG